MRILSKHLTERLAVQKNKFFYDFLGKGGLERITSKFDFVRKGCVGPNFLFSSSSKYPNWSHFPHYVSLMVGAATAINKSSPATGWSTLTCDLSGKEMHQIESQ